MQMDRERGEGRGEGESMRDLGMGWVGEKTDSDWYCCLRSLIFCCCMSGQVETGVHMSLCVCVYCSIGNNGN